MFRNLFMGLGFGLAMIVGGVLGMIFLTPPFGHGPPGDTYDVARAIVVGTILGGIAWKVAEHWRKRPSSN
jgi:hypothetical protein